MLLLEKNAMRARGQSLTRTCLAVGRNRDPRRTAEDAGGAPLTWKLRALGEHSPPRCPGLLHSAGNGLTFTLTHST